MARLDLPPIELPVEPAAEVRRRARRRVEFLGAFLLLGLTGAGVRGVQLALVPDARTLEMAGNGRWGEIVVDGDRGDIFDRDGRRLATSAATPRVFVDPVDVPADRVDEAVDALSGLLGLPKDDLRKRILDRSHRYDVLARNVHPSVEYAVHQLRIPGVTSDRSSRRYYPEEELAAQTLGFVDADGHGRAGLEALLDKDLRGAPLVVQRRRDSQGFGVEEPLEAATRDRARGHDVHTTLDRTIQRATERALAQAVLDHAPKSAYAVVLDVRTGDVLALANWPTYNPNLPPADGAPQTNHVVQDAIEPGSVFKPFTIAAGLEAGVIRADDKIDCEGGFWAVGGSRVRDDHPHGVVSLTEVIKYSSNIASAKVGLKLGAERLVGLLRAVGFGKPTGVDLPWEASGKIRDPAKMRTIELATTSFGQGVTATPIQLAAGLATLANGGRTVRPRLVTRVDDADGVPERIHRVVPGTQVLSASVAADVMRMMETVTEAGGTGTRAAIPGYRVAGKTGTAQKVTNGVYGDARISSYVGVVPADAPILAIAVSVDEPSIGSRYGGIVAAPAFASIGAAALRHLGVPPNPELLAPPQGVPGPEEPHAPSPDRARPTLVWTGRGWQVPDLRDLPMRDALASLEGSGLGVDLSGHGLVREQIPAPGAVLAPGASLTLRLN